MLSRIGVELLQIEADIKNRGKFIANRAINTDRCTTSRDTSEIHPEIHLGESGLVGSGCLD